MTQLVRDRQWWERHLRRWPGRTYQWWKQRCSTLTPTLVVFSSTLVFIFFIGLLSLRRYAALHTHTDLALYSQVVWNTARGDFFRNSVLPFTEHYLGNHFTPIMAAFVPLYVVWEDPRVLLLVQLVASALGAWPLYWLAREQLSSAWAGAMLAGGYLLYPALHHQTLVDFHGIALATPAVMLALYALLTERNRLFFATVPVLLLIREDLPLMIIMMGVYAVVIQRRRRFGATVAGMGLVLTVLIIQVLIPAFRGTGDFYYNEYYNYLGDSLPALLQTVLLSPGVLLERILFLPKFALLVQLLASVAFMPLLAPSTAVLGASALAYLLLVDLPFNQIYTLNSQYQALFIPVILVGAVLGIRRLRTYFGPRFGYRRVSTVAAGAVLVSSAVTLLLWGPLSDPDLRDDYRPDERSSAEWALIEQVPDDAGVVAAGRLTTPFSTREGFFRFGGLFRYDYPLDYLIYLDTPVGYPSHPPAFVGEPNADAWHVPRYEEVGRVETTQLRRRDGTVTAAPLPAPVTFGDALALRGATGAGTPLQATPGQELEVAAVWESLRADLPRLVFFVQLLEERDGAQHLWATADREMYDGLFPTDRWEAGDTVGDVFRVHIPPWVPPGEYQLHAGVYMRDGVERLARPDGATTAVVGIVQVAPPPPLPDRDGVEVPNEINTSIAQGLKLYGYTPLLEHYAPGQPLEVTFFWRATEQMEDEYAAEFLLVPEGDELPATQWRRPLLDGRFPNTEWQPEMVIADWIRLDLPLDLEAGTYRLFVTVTGADDPEPPIELGRVAIGPTE